MDVRCTDTREETDRKTDFESVVLMVEDATARTKWTREMDNYFGDTR